MNDKAGPARTPEALHAVIEDAFNRGDLDACIAVYDEDAVLVVPPDGRQVRGPAEIRAATEALFALRPHMTMAVRKKLQTGTLALTHGRWELVHTAADGTRARLSGHGTMVSRRSPDGTWRIVLDDPLSSVEPPTP